MSKLYNVQISSAYASSFLIHHLSIGFPPPPIVHSLCKRIKNIKRVSKKAILQVVRTPKTIVMVILLHLSTRLSYVSQSTANFRTPKTQKEGVVLGRRQST